MIKIAATPTNRTAAWCSAPAIRWDRGYWSINELRTGTVFYFRLRRIAKVPRPLMPSQAITAVVGSGTRLVENARLSMAK